MATVAPSFRARAETSRTRARTRRGGRVGELAARGARDDGAMESTTTTDSTTNSTDSVTTTGRRPPIDARERERGEDADERAVEVSSREDAEGGVGTAREVTEGGGGGGGGDGVGHAASESEASEGEAEEGGRDEETWEKSDGSEASSSGVESESMVRASVAYPMFLCDERHWDAATTYDDTDAYDGEESGKWRTKDRMKTVSVALVLCLNIGVDPPDTMKISPCARMQCWINPISTQPQNELDAIGKALQAQYERWQPRAKYKLQLDPTTDDMKKLCISCRRNAKGERVLLHYNGHGVPRPTANGEIWVFNKSYTQYIPLSIFDLRAWTGTPAIYVFDCSNAGLIIKSFLKLQQQAEETPSSQAVMRDLESRQAGGSMAFAELSEKRSDLAGPSGFGTSESSSSANECILIAACGANEILPQSADLPADVFSACLTTPVKMALHWFCTNSVLREQGITVDIIDNIPGMQNNRKTPLGELNWIFTAITDTIAWNVLPRKLFQRLFRQDLLVASLFRNFLLAERIMRANNCTPVSSPRLPPTYNHPMWAAWDMAVEQCLLQIPALLSGDPSAEFIPSPFFTDQLTAFEVWLEYGNEHDAPPEQLPIVLQVLLSQSHRLRALILLGRFLDLGLWAVDLALSVGIFPYVLKLLQTTAPELRQILVFIWTKILALDRSCQVDLVKDDGYTYFIRFLQSSNVPVEERAMAAFILAVICDDHKKGQTVCMSSGLMEICLENIKEAALPDTGSPFFLRWLCLCLGKLWEDNPEGQKAACSTEAHKLLASLSTHPSPDTRAAAAYALGTLVLVETSDDTKNSGGEIQELMHEMSTSSLVPSPIPPTSPLGRMPSSVGDITAMERGITLNLIQNVDDASPMVRIETAVALARIARSHKFLVREASIVWKRDYDSVTAKRVVEAKRSESISTRRRFSHASSLGGYDSSVGTTNMSTVEEDGERISSSVASDDMHPSAYSDHGRDPMGSIGDYRGTVPLPPAYPNVSPGDESHHENRSGEGPKGSLYTQLLQALLDLALDAAPAVSAAGVKAIMSVGLETTHPIIQMVTKTGSHAETPRQHSHRRRPSFASFDLIGHERSASKESLDGQTGTLKRTDSWHQRLSNLGSRLLGSPTKTKSSASLRGDGEAPRSPSKSSGGRGVRNSTNRAGKFQGALGSPASSFTHLPSLSIPQTGSRTSDLRISPRNESPLRRTTSTLITDNHDSGHDHSGTLQRHGSHASMDSLEALSPRFGGKTFDGAGFDDAHSGQLPHSMIFKRSCAHFSMALLESAQEEEDEFFDESSNVVAAWLRPPDTKRRTERLKRMHDRAEASRESAEHHLKMTEYVSSIDVGSRFMPTSIIMHPLDSHAIAGDDGGCVNVWDYSNSTRVNKINTGLTKVNMLSLVNETDGALLLTGCDDGAVKIWRDYGEIDKHSLVTAWNTLPSQPLVSDAIGSVPLSYYKPSTHYKIHEFTKAKIVWQQLTGCMYATGNAINPLLRVWDVSSELCRETLNLQSQGTCLTAEGALLMAGTADGAILSYDLRAPARLLSAMQTHTEPLVSILLQPGGVDNLLITGCSNGHMKFYDLRNTSKPFLSAEVAKQSPSTNRPPALTALVGHSCVGVIASGSSERAIKLWDLQGRNFATISYTNSFLGQRIGSVTALAFHPNSLYLAAGSNTSQATVYSHQLQ